METHPGTHGTVYGPHPQSSGPMTTARPCLATPAPSGPTQEDSGPHLGHLCGLCVAVTYGDVRVPGPSTPRGAGKGLRVASSVPGCDLRHTRVHPCMHTHIHMRVYFSPCWLSRASGGQPLGWRASSRACVHCSAPVLEVLSTRASRIQKCFHVEL